MHLWLILQKIKRAVILLRICIETSDLQGKFHSKVAFHKWYFQNYRYFILLLLIRVTYTKFG